MISVLKIKLSAQNDLLLEFQICSESQTGWCRRLQLHAPCHSAIDHQISAADEACSRTCEKHSSIGNFLRRAHSSGWIEIQRRLVNSRVGIPDLVPDDAFKIGCTGRNRVCADALRRQFLGEQLFLINDGLILSNSKCMLNGSGCPFTHTAKRCIGIRSIKELPGQRQLETYVLISHLIASSAHLYRSIQAAPRGRASSSSQWLVYEFAA